METNRLRIRPFVVADLADAHRLFDVELQEADMGADKIETLEERAAWLQWAVLNYVQLAKLNQPPYGDRAIIRKSTGQLIGSCGFVPCLNAFEQLPGFAAGDPQPAAGRHLAGRYSAGCYSPEFGLFYAISPAQQRQGYAAEAAGALLDYAFQHLGLKRVIAETDYDNVGSIGVMRKLGMRIEKNPYPEPPWLQVVGVAEYHPQEGNSPHV